MLLVARIAVFVLALPLLATSPAPQSQLGVVTDLGGFGGPSSLAHDINDRGEVVGRAQDPSRREFAFLWQRGTLRKLDQNPSRAYGINNASQVVGEVQSPRKRWEAALWSNGARVELGTLGGKESVAVAINDPGQVVGAADLPTGKQHAFLWQAGQMRDLGTLGGANSGAFALNNAGEIALWSQNGDRRPIIVGALWDHGLLTELGTLGRDVVPEAINDQDEIVGTAYNTAYVARPFVWRSGTLAPLDSKPGDALDNNELGDVVGSTRGPSGQRSAMLWRNQRPIDLNTLINPSSGWHLTVAWAINNRGQVVGEGRFRELSSRAFLLPLP